MTARIGEALQMRLQSAQDYDTIEVNIFLKEEPARVIGSLALDSVGDESRDPIDLVKRRCRDSQGDLLQMLANAPSAVGAADGLRSASPAVKATSFWINNAVSARVSRALLDKLRGRNDVAYLDLVRHIDLKELLDTRSKGTKPRAKAGDSSSDNLASAADAPSPTWSVERINAPQLWQVGIRGEGILVAVVDTGVNYKHPDLTNRMWDGGVDYPHHGYDFGANDKDPMDDDGHGTCCAGIVAGDGTQGTITGVAPLATIMALRVGGSEQAIWKALEFALDQKAHVISMSMTWKYPWNPDYPGWRRTCETIHAAGTLHANSIGNQGDQLGTHPVPYNIATPGNCPPPRLHPLQSITGGLSSPISCGATDDTDQLATYSGRGPAAWEKAPYLDYPHQSGAQAGLLKPDVCAPGPGTTSCNYLFPGTSTHPYTGFGGTSSATPHVAGCLALLADACLRAGKPIVAAQIQESLENTAVRIPGQTTDKENHYGAGRVNVLAAYNYGQNKAWW